MFWGRWGRHVWRLTLAAAAAADCCRIQFEVSVRVLGGLMALGYEIGTVMRRTSTLMTSQSGDLTVKFDDVEHLGKFVQVGLGDVCVCVCLFVGSFGGS